MYDRILRENKGKWERIAHNQCPLLFHPAEGALKEQAKRCECGWGWFYYGWGWFCVGGASSNLGDARPALVGVVWGGGLVPVWV